MGGMCTKDPSYMIENCKVSCNNCPKDKITSYEDSEELYPPLFEEVEAKKLLDLLERIQDYGVAQNVKENKRHTIEYLENALQYMESVKDEGIFDESFLKKCVNESPLCAIWAVEGGCKTREDAIEKCGPMCETCHFIGDFDLDTEVSERIDDMSKEDLLEEIKKYGVAQDITDTEGNESILVMIMIKLTVKYMNTLDEDIAKDRRNEDALCSFWSATGECGEDREYMEIYCAPSCESCEDMI